jgi:hypothetical protein
MAIKQQEKDVGDLREHLPIMRSLAYWPECSMKVVADKCISQLIIHMARLSMSLI